MTELSKFCLDIVIKFLIKGQVRYGYFNHYSKEPIELKKEDKKHTFELRQARRLGVKPNPLS